MCMSCFKFNCGLCILCRDVCLVSGSCWPSPALVFRLAWLPLVSCRHSGWKQKAFIRVSGDIVPGQHPPPNCHQHHHRHQRHPMMHLPVLTMPTVVSGDLVGYEDHIVGLLYLEIYEALLSGGPLMRSTPSAKDHERRNSFKKGNGRKTQNVPPRPNLQIKFYF